MKYVLRLSKIYLGTFNNCIKHSLGKDSAFGAYFCVIFSLSSRQATIELLLLLGVKNYYKDKI